MCVCMCNAKYARAYPFFPRPFSPLAARMTLARMDREELKMSAAPPIIPEREKNHRRREKFAAKYDNDNLPRPFHAIFF